MQHIKIYYAKIENMLRKRSNNDTKIKSKKGLLAPSSRNKEVSKTENQQMEMIVDIVEGIRKAREEILNAKK